MGPAIRGSTLEGRAPKKLPPGVKVIDVDVHLHELPKAILPYCEMPWRKSLESIAALPQPNFDIPYYCPALTVWTPPFPPILGERRHTVTSAAQMRKDLDEMSVDVGVIFPDHYLHLAVLRDASYATALARAYNRWLTDEWLGEDNGLKGAVLIPPQNPVAAAEEIRRYAGHKNVVAICLPASCLETLYGQRCYDPLYEAAQETGLPVMLHSAGGVFPVFPFNTNCFSSIFSIHIVSHAFSMMANLLSMMETGVPARFPQLKIGFIEAGFAWRSWIMLRMDKEFTVRRREMPLRSCRLVRPPDASRAPTTASRPSCMATRGL